MKKKRIKVIFYFHNSLWYDKKTFVTPFSGTLKKSENENLLEFFFSGPGSRCSEFSGYTVQNFPEIFFKKYYRTFKKYCFRNIFSNMFD